MNDDNVIRVRQKLGKYRIERKLGVGGFAAVYQATDTVEGVPVALKIPHDHIIDQSVLEDFRKEVRLASKLKHPNILSLKTADYIEGRLVMAFPLGERSLADRLQSRMSLGTVLDYTQQMLDAIAYAHEHNIIHCDIKPENFILFSNGYLQLGDFGIARIAMRTIRASGSGTLGFCAPEQAMGKPSFRSDVFSLGLILYRMLTGHLPEYPFQWPPPGYRRLRERLPEAGIDWIRRSIEFDARKRFADAGAMRTAFNRIKPRLQKRVPSGATSRNSRGQARRKSKPKSTSGRPDWKTIRRRQFEREFGRQLATHYNCRHCTGPISEFMSGCPWCGTRHDFPVDLTSFPQQCPRCHRGMKLDWHYCPWCYGPGFEVETSRKYPDARYVARCENNACERKELMPFMRYCPWCRHKVKRPWRIEGSREQCPGCGWGVLSDYWSYCPWCLRSLNRR